MLVYRYGRTQANMDGLRQCDDLPWLGNQYSLLGRKNILVTVEHSLGFQNSPPISPCIVID